MAQASFHRRPGELDGRIHRAECDVNEWLVAVNGTRLWVAEQGAGEPIVLCSGGPGYCDYLGPVAAMIHDRARVYRFEPRGCGRSAMNGPYDLPTWIADLDALRSALGYERWIVGGHSAGADFALAYALTHPKRVRALISLSATGVQNDRQWHAAYEAGRVAHPTRLPLFAYPFNPRVNRAGVASWRVFIKQPQVLRQIADLRIPALVMHGSADNSPSWPVQQLAALLPNARFVLVAGGGHHLELTHPDELRACLRDFLDVALAPRG
jgi:proline iminopeptidase